ncbi:hypothetical protein [Sporocytophaga myxococcoides]|uniref:hypothetical protein n=1 Tax=Sporocytophaga myxococcoides TaxID=153721 RepID=UPI00042A02B9|nr:hypothetical protein [Sporocytophaga myxococcoides]
MKDIDYKLSNQKSFNAVAEIMHGREKALKELLKLGMKKISGSLNLDIHFFRWFLITGENIVLDEFDIASKPDLEKSYLVFSMNYDGDKDTVLLNLYKLLESFIDKIYSLCYGYTSESDSQAFLCYIKSNAIKESLFWVGKPGWSVKRIIAERNLRSEVEKELSVLDPSEFPEKAEAIRNKYKESTFKSHPWYKVIWTLRLMWRLLVCLVLGITFSPVGILFSLYRQYIVKDVKAKPSKVNYDHYKKISKEENNVLQNQLSVHGILKNSPTWIWYWKFQVSLSLARFSGGRKRSGKLAGIESIHFVKWLIIPNKFIHPGKKKEKIFHCLFLSDYDGTWESYISDFIDRGAQAINFNFSNMRGYPKVSFSFKGGASSGTSFKPLVRKNQIECPFWYSGYADVVMKDKLRNASISDGIQKEKMSDAEFHQWLKLFA